MKPQFNPYQTRLTRFCNVIEIENWQIKVYTITKNQEFTANETLKAAIKNLPKWLNIARKAKAPTYNIGLLIVHEAREGTIVLLSWWIGGEMIQTKIYFAKRQTPKVFSKKFLGTNALVCVWELLIYEHERKAWIKHVLMKAKNPDFKNYLKDSLTTH